MSKLKLSKKFMRWMISKNSSQLIKASGIIKVSKIVILSLLMATIMNLRMAGAQEFLFSIPAGAEGSHLDVAANRRADLYVLDVWSRHVNRYSYPDQLNLTFGGAEVFTDDPFGIAIDGEGNIYVADTINDQIQKFDFQGNHLLTFRTGDQNVIRLALDDQGNIYVTESDRILKFDPNGALLLTFGSRGSGDGEFDTPWGIEVDDADKVYVADLGNHRVQVFDTNGNFLFKFGVPGTESGQFLRPHDVTVDRFGNIYVADTNNYRIQMFDSGSNFLRMWGWGVRDGANEFQVCDNSETPCQVGIAGSGEGQFSGSERSFNLSALAFNNIELVLFAADSGNNRVQVFDVGISPVGPPGSNMGGGGSGGESCSIAAAGNTTSSPLYLLIPVLVFIRRLWVRIRK